MAIVRDAVDLKDLYHRWSISSAGQTNPYLSDGVGADAVANTLMLHRNDAYDGKTLTSNSSPFSFDRPIKEIK